MTDSHAVCSGSRCIYDGTDCQFEVEGLQANKQYTYKVRAYTEGDITSFSDTITVTTEEDCEFPVVLQSLFQLCGFTTSKQNHICYNIYKWYTEI